MDYQEMPLVISNSVTGGFEYPQGWAEWVVRDANTDIQIDYLVETEWWPELCATLAKMAGIAAEDYDAAARTAVDMENLTITTGWLRSRDLPLGKRSANALWIDNAAEAYRLWLHGVPETLWSDTYNGVGDTEREVGVEEFQAFWEALHAKAACLKEIYQRRRAVSARKSQGTEAIQEGRMLRAIEGLAPPEGAVLIDDADESKVN